MKILIVEDNEINVRVLSIMLGDLSFDISLAVAEDAERALEETADSQFDLILMDINLGDGLMSGSEVMEILRTKDGYISTPIYAVTCYSLPGDRERFLAQGFDRYFAKPVSKDLLLRSITEDLRRES